MRSTIQTMRIPFGTVTITEKAKALILDSIERGRISNGRLVREFEESIAFLMGAEEAVAVSSGTDAVALAVAVLYDLGAQRGDEVIVPALSFVATGNAVLHAGFRPRFVDVDRRTLNIDPHQIEAAITHRTRGIVPVHLMGKPAEMDVICTLAKKYGLKVIEDAAEAYGAVYKGKNIGTIGDMAAFSLYVAHIITTGEGGIVITDKEEYADILRSLRAHGRSCKCKECISNVTSGFCSKRFDHEIGDLRFHFERVGFSSKMNELEAAIGLGTIDLYQEIVDRRHSNLMSMIEGFQQFSEFIQVFPEELHERIGPHAFPFVILEGAPFTRDELMLYLEKNGVDPRTLFSSIPTQCGGFEFLGYRAGDFPNAEYVGRNGIHIGVHQGVTPTDIAWLIELVRKFILKKTTQR
jgi:dTDP-4-amino-4,6-dideoxygalactose transaminase